MQTLTTRRLSWHSKHQNKEQDQNGITQVMQGWFHQGDSTILEMYAPNKGASKDMKKQTRTEKRNRQIHNYRWRFHTPPSGTVRRWRQSE